MASVLFGRRILIDLDLLIGIDRLDVAVILRLLSCV